MTAVCPAGNGDVVTPASGPATPLWVDSGDVDSVEDLETGAPLMVLDSVVFLESADVARVVYCGFPLVPVGVLSFTMEVDFVERVAESTMFDCPYQCG